MLPPPAVSGMSPIFTHPRPGRHRQTRILTLPRTARTYPAQELARPRPAQVAGGRRRRGHHPPQPPIWQGGGTPHPRHPAAEQRLGRVSSLRCRPVRRLCSCGRLTAPPGRVAGSALARIAARLRIRMLACAPCAVMRAEAGLLQPALDKRTGYHDQRSPGRQVPVFGPSVCGDDTERMLICVSEAILDIRFTTEKTTD